MKKIYLLLLLFLNFSIVFSQANWKLTGPNLFPTNASGQIHGIGRVSQMKFSPSNAQKMYAVSASGGLWISNDGGNNWNKTNTDNLPRTACASVCVDHTNDQVLYLGTGDANYYGRNFGIWKSTDGGNTWNQSNSGIGNRLAIDIVMDPTNRNTLVAATDDGIWKSTDAGATWTVKKSGGDFKAMVFKPVANSQTLYASTSSEFWRSTNMGENWTRTTISGSGMSDGGRVGVSKADPNVVYLTFVGSFSSGTSTPVFKSTDSGASFFTVKAAGQPNLNGYEPNEGGQNNYNYGIIVDPTNVNVLYVCGHVIWKSTNGGASWTKLTNWYQKVHTDMHEYIFDPANSSRLFNANDGGVWLSTDGGNNWTPKSDGLAATECYHSAQSPIRKDMNYIGTQDNGELYFSNGGWFTNRGGDWGSRMALDYQNTTLCYYYENGRRRSFSQGEQNLNLPFTTGNDIEMEFNPIEKNIAFVGKADVYRTSNLSTNPPTWTKITNINQAVKAIGSSPADANVLYVVTANQQVHRSDNALSATPSFTTYTAPGATNGRASIAVVKSNPNVVYLSCGNRVYRSTDKGASWTNISGTLPTVNIIKLHNDVNTNDESIYLGMATGVYYKNSSMSNWQNYSQGLPTVAHINDLMMYNDGTTNSILRVAYYGRGVWESSLNSNTNILRDPENPAITISGVEYKYYEGNWTLLPNFNSLTPVKTGTVPTFELTPRNRNDEFGFSYTGYVDVPADGQYTFYTTSDDGSRLYIGDRMVVDNDGLHGEIEKSGTIGLKKGKHAISLVFFEQFYGDFLSVSFSSPSLVKQTIPSSSLFRLPPPVSCAGSGTILREVWNNIGGNEISSIPVSTTPSTSGTITSFEAPSEAGDNYGQRIRGFICPPYTGAYTFWISSDDGSELWLSTDQNAANKAKIAFLTWSNPRSWDENPTQKSASINLVAGQKYYIEALHKEGGGEDHLAIGWQLPEGTYERPIPGNRLLPFIQNANPTISITSPVNNASYFAPATIGISVNAADSDGTIAKVEYFNGTTLIGQSTASPFGISWNNVAAGTYTITAKATDDKGASTTSAAIIVSVTNLRNPENPASTVSGLDYSYYEGTYSVLPNFATLTPVKTGTVSSFDITPRNRGDQFSFNFVGYVNVPTDGIYTFYTSSDDGSRLYIGTTLVVDNDGLHGTVEKSGTIGLKAGKHAISTGFFEQGGGEVLTVSYSGPGIAKQLIPGSVLFRIQTVTNVNPTVSLTAPTSGATYVAPASVTFSANAADSDGSISKVEFYNGTQLLGEDLTSPYSFVWSNVAVGSYSITAKATDNATGTATSAAVTIQVTAPAVMASFYEHCNYDPTGYAVDLAEGSYTTAQLIAKGIKDNDVSSLKVKSGYEVVLYQLDNFTGTSLIFKTDNPCLVANSINDWASSLIIRTASAENQPPVASVTSPANNTNYIAPASIVINANASDNDGNVAKVEFFNGTSKLGEDATSPYSFNWTNVSAGTYQLTAVATDNSNTTGTSSVITVVVANPNSVPVISIAAPLNNAQFTAPASIVINANASDADGSVSKVEFYNGTSKLGEDASSPYSFSWSNVATGTYQLTAKATDNNNAVTTSGVVTVIVSAGTDACANVAQYSENNGYVAGSKVKNNGSIYECKPWPNSGWCNGGSWAYSPGDGLYWSDAWVLVGPCNSAPQVSLATPAKKSIESYPNPFVEATTITFEVAVNGNVEVVLYDQAGNKVADLFNGNLNAGTHSVKVTNSELATGTYICKVVSKNKTEAINILKLKQPKKN